MTDKKLAKLPYCIGSYEKLRRLGYYYVDKTRFIERLESLSCLYPIIVRPRRFGKTLFTDVLAAYYDEAAAVDFDRNFAGTYIGGHPTSERSQYCVLRFNFSGIAAENFSRGFLETMRKGFLSFAQRYPFEGAAQYTDKRVPDETKSPDLYLSSFLSALPEEIQGRIYLIIDEYDQFANEILANDINQFRAVMSAGGMVKAFYAQLKNAVESENIIAKMFITGVTKISLDSMTSGFSIATDISNYGAFADLFGFTETELREMIRRSVDLTKGRTSEDEIFARMKDYYNGYRFSTECPTTVFNSSMCLYYLSNLQRSGEEPENLFDPAVSFDSAKMGKLLALGNTQDVDEAVKTVLKGETLTIGSFFDNLNLNQKNRFNRDNTLKSLYYLGYLTLSRENTTRLTCPNKAVRSQFFDYFYENMEDFSRKMNPISVREATTKLHQGEIRPLLTVVAEYLREGQGLHAFAHFDESNIQTAVHMAVNLTTDYRSEIETEATGIGYVDMLLTPVWKKDSSPSYLLEFKYLSKSDATEAALEEACSAAETQIQKYCADAKIQALPRLMKYVVVFSGPVLARLEAV